MGRNREKTSIPYSQKQSSPQIVFNLYLQENAMNIAQLLMWTVEWRQWRGMRHTPRHIFQSSRLKFSKETGFQRGALPPQASQVALVVKNLPPNTGDMRDLGSIPGLGRSPGGGNGNPPQYSCLGNPMDRGAWWAKRHDWATNTFTSL